MLSLYLTWDSDQFLARLTDESGTERARHRFSLPLDQLRTHDLLRRVEAGATTLASEAGVGAGVVLGKQLYDAALGGEVGNAFREAQASATSLRQPVHLRLRIQPAELLNLPWELLHDGTRFLLLSSDLFLSRSPADLDDLAVQPTPLPLRVLVILSNPLDLPPDQQLHTELEEILGRALEALVRSGQVQVDYVDEATADEMQKALLANAYHIIHYTGHGGFDAQTGRGLLTVQNEQGNAVPMDSEQIANLWERRAACSSSC